MFRPLRTHQIVADAVIVLAYVALVGALEQYATTPGGAGVAVVVGIFAVAVAVRRYAPGISLGVAWLASLIQMALGLPPGPADLAVFLVLYAVAAYGSRIEFWAGLASTVLGAVAITVYLLRQSLGPGLSISDIPMALIVLVAALFALLLSWTAGALVRTANRARENRLAREVAQAVASAEHERVRIARDVHDVVAHSLAVVIAQADGARYAAGPDASGPAAEALSTIAQTARAALGDVRMLLGQLRHSAPEGPQPRLADLEALYGQVRAAGAALTVDVDPAPRSEPAAGVQLAVYRILQEALTNALRHGGTGTVAVRLAWHPDRVDLEVRNPIAGVPRPWGHGIIGMTERASLAGGRLEAVVEDDSFVVRARIPTGRLA